MNAEETTGHKSGSDSVVFDLKGTLKRLGGDRGLLSDLIQLFAEDAPLWLARMTQGLADGKAAELRHAAHALRGLAANFGAFRLTATLFQLEEKSAVGTISDARYLVDEARTATEQLQQALEPYRHTISS